MPDTDHAPVPGHDPGDDPTRESDRSGELTPDELQIAFHEVECQTYDERFGISYDEHSARQAAHEAERLLGTTRFGRVLDVGCGTGYLGLGLAVVGRADELHLSDISPGMLSRAQQNAVALGVDATFTQASATALPYPDDCFDAVVTRGVLHHLHDVPAALREWRRVAKPGAPVLAISEPTPWADRIGGFVARSALAGLRWARPAARRLGRPFSEHDEETAALNHYWDLVAMAANLHTFDPADLEALGREAGFDRVEVRGSGMLSIGWAAAYYCLVGELPDLAASPRAKRTSGRVFGMLRRVDAAVTERVIPDPYLMTVQAVFTAD
jgi:ubiquinone/menaquinone biosynthesis C-methylase UbiE